MTTSVAVPPSNAPYSTADRAFARTMIHAHGSLSGARKHLTELWLGDDAIETSPGRVPTLVVLARWRDDASLPIDADLVAQFRDYARSFIVGSAFRIAERAEQATLEALNSGEALDASRFMQVWQGAADKLVPTDRSAGQFGAIPRGLGPGQKFTAMTTFTVEQSTPDTFVSERAE